MDWIKIPVDDILYSDFKKWETHALIIYLALYSHLEKDPTDKQLKQFLSPKEYKLVKNQSGFGQDLVKNQIEKVIQKRNKSKERYNNANDLQKIPPAESKQSAGNLPKQIREDKIREEKNIINSFNLIWNKYPNKDGKKAAERHFKNSVKTKEDLESINKALDNYLKCKKVKDGFVKNGSTWFNNWQDWIDYEEVKTEEEKQKEKVPEALRKYL